MKTLKEMSKELQPCCNAGPCGDGDETDEQQLDKRRQQDDGRTRFIPIEFLLSCIAMCVGLGNVWRFPFTAYTNGVGYMAAFATCCISSYYCSVMSLSIYYFIVSFSTTLPWTECNPKWEGVVCDNGTAWETKWNGTMDVTTETFISSVYLKRTVTHAKDSIDDGIGLPDWKLTLCLLFAWVLLFLILVKGVKSIGKASYFTAIFPYVVLFIMLGQGLTLDGAWDGILHFITPRWAELLNWRVWYAAVTQCFFSLSVGTGATIMLGSYNRFDHNLCRDAKIITVVDTLTSLLAGCTIFAVLGHLSLVLGKDIDDVSDGGTNLAFEAYPLIHAKIGWAPQLFAVLFFLMLFTLGIGSSTSDVNAIITIILDRKPNWRKEYIAGGVCLAGFLLGLVYVTPGGEKILELVDIHGAGFVIFITATLEVIAISWFYGLKNICRDLEFMLGTTLSWYWKICWGIITPGALSILLVLELKAFQPVEKLPTSATVCGWILSTLAILILPFCAIQVILRRSEHSLIEKIRNSWKPAAAWGPSQWMDRQRWEVEAHGQDVQL